MESIVIGGKEIFYIDNDDPVISYLKKGVLFGEGNYKLLSRFIFGDGVILDCGGHIGTFALPASKRHSVIVIEAAAQNVECLNETFKHNVNVYVVPAILADRQKRCDFSDTIGPFGWIIENENGAFETTTIDAVCDGTNIAAIKLDIEGGEREALIGAVKTLDRCRPPILMEINGYCLLQRKETPQQLLEQVYAVDYVPYFLLDKVYKINPEDMFPFCVTDVICIHKDNIQIYPGLGEVPSLDQYSIRSLISKNFLASNDHCKQYFRSIGYNGEFV